MARQKGYRSPDPHKCRAAHFVDPVVTTISKCKRSPIRFTAVASAAPARQRLFRALPVCDHCQRVVHQERAHPKGISGGMP